MKKEKQPSQSNDKKSLIKRILSKTKGFILKTCGKARWLLLGFIVLMAVTIYISTDIDAEKYIRGVRDEDNVDVTETTLKDVTSFSVNSKGLAAVRCSIGTDGMSSIFDIETGEQRYANIADMDIDGFDLTVRPGAFLLTDDDELYSVIPTSDENCFITKLDVICISDKYEYKNTVCEIDFDPADRRRSSTVSKLCYHDGAVSFALIQKAGVTLYSIDTKTRTVTKSDLYKNDQNGTYTNLVIPIDGEFIFLRSDGRVYRTGFGEPLENEIYRYDISDNGDCENFFFTQAAIADGKLYVTGKTHKGQVYTLENGKLTKAIDIDDIPAAQGQKIEYIDTYRPEGADSDTLAICLENGLLTYSGGELTDRNITIKTDKYPAWVIEDIVGLTIDLLIIGLIINLFIRKKTLLFKQIIITLPVVMILIFVTAYNLYDYYMQQHNESIEKDVGIICELGSAEFEGYDFSPLLKVDENTGEAYYSLCDKLESIRTGQLKSMGEEYVLSIIYHKNNGDDVLIAKDDMGCMPLYSTDNTLRESKIDKKNKVQIVSNVDDFMSQGARTSSISAFREIADKDGSGQFYLKVSTENTTFWTQRRAFIFKIATYCMLILIIMTVLITLTSLYITKTINKAKKAVERISEGDMKARVSYRSKDELGEICSKVNEMGQSLETLFDEKDKTENFYYKFVPEKFREYLGKENFTDLSLGDASSRELTVLFCDIRSFSINSEIMTAKENFSFVNVIYGKAGPIIRENNGFVDKYIGDAVMALFENADDAVKCGIELYKAIVLDPETAKELKVSDINIGIGVHSGMAMIGIVGESERLSGTVISDTVNLSSRLESLTKQYKTAMLISKDTVDRLTDPEALGLRYLGIVQVAGVNEVKAVYEVLDCLPEGLKEVRTENSSQLREAIRLFHLGRRGDAADALRELKDRGMNDHISDMYLGYIEKMSDDDKGNVFRFVRK